MQRDIEPVPIPRIAHCLQAVGKPFSVTVFAAGADLAAARHRVPRRVGPFDRRLVTHNVSLPYLPLSAAAPASCMEPALASRTREDSPPLSALGALGQ